MYEELIQDLRGKAEFLRHANRGSNIHNSFAETMSQAADAIESTNKAYQMISEAYEAEVTKQNWIPVTERLPKEMVLALGRDRDIRSLEYSFTKKWWEDDDGYYCDTNYVTHWMPLPKPPKEET